MLEGAIRQIKGDCVYGGLMEVVNWEDKAAAGPATDLGRWKLLETVDTLAS